MLWAIAMMAAAAPAAPQAGMMLKGRITGIGGVFVKSPDPKKLAAWYRDVLGIQIQPWGGAILPYATPGHPPQAVWGPFKATTRYMEPSKRDFMINFAVDDIDVFVAQLKAKGVAILKRQDDATGRFAWIMDPDGTKIELWEPPRR